MAAAGADLVGGAGDVDTVTYANADLTETFKVFERQGIRFLTADEIRTEMPQYPL
jgi:hypothetical protein